MSNGQVLFDFEPRGHVLKGDKIMSKVFITKGQDKEIKLRLFQLNGDPVNLTDRDDLLARFYADDGTYVELQETAITEENPTSEITVDDAALGRITLNLPAEKSALLKKGDRLPFEIRVEEDGLIDVILMPDVLWIRDSIGV
jgi:hypothetical protein